MLVKEQNIDKRNQPIPKLRDRYAMIMDWKT
jgi:hypothetical protein